MASSSSSDPSPEIHVHHGQVEINGQDLDDFELETAGYKREMPRHFTTFSLMSLSYNLTCTWNGTGASFGISLVEAGPAGTIWSLVPAAVMTAVLSGGMAELASAYPIAGAQYYWSYMVSSPKHKPFAAYMNGWLSVIGWWMGMASVVNFVSSMILSIAAIWHPDYVIERYHQYLLYVGLTWLALLINVFGSKWIPQYNTFNMILGILTPVATFITLLVCSRNRYPSGSWLFSHTINNTGWSSDAFAFLLAINNALYGFQGTDAAAHLCEEIPNPSKNVPKVIMWPILLGLLTTWPFTVACMASINDLESVLDTPSGVPLLEIYYQGTGGSKIGATILEILFVLCMFGCIVGNGTTSSRTLWAISRDGALPYSHLWARVHPRWKMPVNAMCLTACVITVYGLIFIGSSSVFSSMVGTAILFLQSTCVFPQLILLMRGRSILPRRYFTIPEPFGFLTNLTAVVWVLYTNIVFCIPSARPVTADNMDWVSVVFVGLMAWVMGLWWVSKRGKFTGPKVDLEKMRRRREEALGIRDMVERSKQQDGEIIKITMDDPVTEKE